MNKERYDMCKKFIEEGRWDIDVAEGIVIGKKGGIGRPDGGTGYLKHTVSYMGKKYNFRDHEIIAIAGGMYPVDVTVDHINGNKLDNRFCNLQMLSNTDNIRKSQVGTHHSEEIKRKIGDSNKKNTSCNKEVICVETGIVYLSTLEAQRQLGVNHGSISRCCSNKQNVAGGYHWRYVPQN